MMTKLLSDVDACERKEFVRAAEQHGYTFHSLHEAYAVTLEEVEEAGFEMQAIDGEIRKLWDATRHDDTDYAYEVVEALHKKALCLAAEAIQVAAMARKGLKSIECYKLQEAKKDTQIAQTAEQVLQGRSRRIDKHTQNPA